MYNALKNYLSCSEHSSYIFVCIYNIDKIASPYWNCLISYPASISATQHNDFLNNGTEVTEFTMLICFTDKLERPLIVYHLNFCMASIQIVDKQ